MPISRHSHKRISWKEVKIVQANANALKGHEKLSLCSVWNAVKDWTKETLSNERMKEIVLATAFLTLLGWMEFGLYLAMQNH